MEKTESSDDIVDEKDVKTEVMRSRGAGGQASLFPTPAAQKERKQRRKNS